MSVKLIYVTKLRNASNNLMLKSSLEMQISINDKY
jgi:hypothetical protein